MLQPLLPRYPNPKIAKSARVNRLRAAVLALGAFSVAVTLAAGPGSALPVSHTGANPTESPAPVKARNELAPVLPLGSSVFFVLDDSINSHSAKVGSFVRAHLRDSLVVGGRTIAPAGTPVRIEIVNDSPAQIGNVDGSMQIYFEALTLPSGTILPLHTPTAHLEPHMSAGQESTRGLTDTVADIFIPYHYLYHVLRKGQDVVLRPGTVIRARTAATLTTAKGGIVSIATPAPFSMNLDRPFAAFSPSPTATVPGFALPTPKPRPRSNPQ